MCVCVCVCVCVYSAFVDMDSTDSKMVYIVTTVR